MFLTSLINSMNMVLKICKNIYVKYRCFKYSHNAYNLSVFTFFFVINKSYFKQLITSFLRENCTKKFTNIKQISYMLCYNIKTIKYA